MLQELDIDSNVLKMFEDTEASLSNIFDEKGFEYPIVELIKNKLEEKNTLRVLSAFHKYQISEVHFSSTTGYGYNDIGRDTIEKVFASVLGSEDALVRSQFISGTHALTVALFAYASIANFCVK